MKRLASEILPPSNAHLAIALSVVLMAGAVEGRQSPDTGPSFLQRMPKWEASQLIKQAFKKKEEPTIQLNLAPGWSIVSKGPVIVEYPLFVRLAPWLRP
jgi:hypothetical protein